MKVAIIDKCPSRVDYSKYFDFEFDEYHLSSIQLQKVLKKDVDIEIDESKYDFIILVGSEAAKFFAKAAVTTTAGILLEDKYLTLSNPAALIFRPEGKPEFDRTVHKITEYVKGTKKKAAIGDFKGIVDTKEAIEFLQEVLVHADRFVALDTEATSLYVRNGYVLGISISYKLFHGRYISADCIDYDCVQLLQAIVDKYEIIFHNLKFDWKMIEYHFGIKFDPKRSHDTMVEHYVLDEAEGTHGLKLLAIKYTSYGDYDSELVNFKENYCTANNLTKEEFNYGMIPFDIICVYAAIDTAATLELHGKFLPLIEANPKLRELYYNLMIPSTVFLTEMEEVGIPMSKERLNLAAEYLEKEITAAKEYLYTFEEVRNFEKIQGKIFNPNSVVQLRSLLFDFLNLTPTGKLTGTGAISTDAEVLESLSAEHPIPNAILTIRKLTKIRSTYVDKIIVSLDADGHVRTNFNNTFTTSGRLSSSGKFNAQQIPRDNPIIKGCIQAPVGWSITQQDLTTAEMYYAAVLSGDKNLMKVFQDKGDFHSSIAKMVFSLPCAVEDVKKLFPVQRQAAKAVSFGILYGSGAKKVSETVSKESGTHFSLQDAQETIDYYFRTFSKLKKWLADQKHFIEANGYCYSYFGRKRRLPNVFSADKGIAAHEVRSGINAQVQSLASDINMFGAMEAANEFRAKGLKARVFMLVHDSIVVLHPDEETEQVCEILRTCTQKDRGCSIPGSPIGVDQDTHRDYSVGKFEKYYEIIDGKLSRISDS